jgi:hypothetical protein
MHIAPSRETSPPKLDDQPSRAASPNSGSPLLVKVSEAKGAGKMECVKSLKFWLPMNGYEQEIIVPSEYVESIIEPAVGHEAGHIIAAHHLNARVLGIALGFLPERSQQGMFLQALYGWKDATVEARCVVMAAGPAADILFRDGLDERGASGDLQDIEALTGQAAFGPFLDAAKNILARYTSEFSRITNALRHSLELERERRLGLLPTNRIGTLLLDEAQLMSCLTKSSSQVL